MRVKKTVRSTPQGKDYNAYSVTGGSLDIRQLARMISDKKGIPLIRVIDVLYATIDLITEQLAEGNKILLDNFGTFRPSVADNKAGKPKFSSVSFVPAKPLSVAMDNTSVKVIV